MTLSIIIPTYNRGTILPRVLGELARQCADSAAEIVVIDDGSADETATIVQEWASSAPVPASFLRQDHRGPAAARNRGIAVARGDIVLFLGDDVVPGPGLLAAHRRRHEAFPEREVAVLGMVTWSPALPVTPLMRWLEHGGPQFCYHQITDPEAVPPTFFWTANVSVKAAFVREAGGFDERFPGAAFEDVELGARLAKRGMRLHFEPAAVGYHHHPVTLASSLARMESLARGALIASETLPEMVALGDGGAFRRARRRIAHSSVVRRSLVAIAPLCTAVPPLRAPYFRLVHTLHYRAAVRRLAREGSCSPS